MVLHSLQLPSCISYKGGNLADFVADLTALFWFEPIKVLRDAEKKPSGAYSVHRVADINPNSLQSLKKWVQNMLSTTQVTQNVVFLALLFIYRLKVINPTVRGRPGSEYRLITLALMLGNKYLDDNTYTNKTWADVSAIPVGEIHIMEVEFLNSMRYSLAVSAEQWEEWLVKLGNFWNYIEADRRSPSPLLIPSPSQRPYVSPLPSPSVALRYTPALQPVNHSFDAYTSQSPSAYSIGGGVQSWSSSFASNQPISPLALKPEGYAQASIPRKRSFTEQDVTEPPAKRTNRLPVLSSQQAHVSQAPSQPASQAPRQPASQPLAASQQYYHIHQPASAPPVTAQIQQQPLSRGLPGVISNQARLSVPNLTLNTAQSQLGSQPVSSQPYANAVYAPPHASPLSLPPISSGMRAMSTVFPATTAYNTQHPLTATSGPVHIPTTAAVVTPTSAYPPALYGTPTKRLSPQNGGYSSHAPYAMSSPLVDAYGHHSSTPNLGSASGVHTPVSHSPSVYLQNRDSPYKPVRHVNKLLHPPPAAFLQQYQLSNPFPPEQMHYHAVGRRNDLRTGILPEFAHVPALGPRHQMAPTAPYHPTGLQHVLPNPQRQPSVYQTTYQSQP